MKSQTPPKCELIVMCTLPNLLWVSLSKMIFWWSSLKSQTPPKCIYLHTKLLLIANEKHKLVCCEHRTFFVRQPISLNLQAHTVLKYREITRSDIINLVHVPLTSHYKWEIATWKLGGGGALRNQHIEYRIPDQGV